MEKYLEQLQVQLDSLKIKKTPKSFLQIINKTYDEVLISKYVAYILDERNTNVKIVEQMLKKTENNAVEKKHDFFALLDECQLESVETEVMISPQDRLDILIKYNNFWIAIENKVNSWETKENQTKIYEKYINKKNTNNLPVKFIYLKPNYNKSIPSSDNFSVLNFSDLVEIFKSVRAEDLADSENYQYIIDFVKHSEEFLMKDSQINLDRDELKFYLNNKEKLDKIKNIYDSQCKIIRNMLTDSIKLNFKNYEIHDTRTYIQIYKNNWENKNSVGVHFELMASSPNFTSLLGEKSVKIKFAIHNEQNTRNKYKNIPHKTLITNRYSFKTSEEINNSINSIVKTLEEIIMANAEQIDKELNKL